MRFVRPVMNTVGGITHRVRDIARLQEVARILVGHGFGFLVADVGLPGIGRAHSRFSGTPERAAKALEQLGPTFIKLGQVLSTRPDIVPESWLAELQNLQDDNSPLPIAVIEKELATELGADWRSLFTDFGEEALGTASIAQAHGAVLADGRQVVLKVRRPNIARKIRSDLSILELLARRLLAEFPETEELDPLGVLAEFERSIMGELDMLQEARATERIRRNFEGHEGVRVPLVYKELCSQRVLCLEYLDGVPIRVAREHGHDMEVVGARYLDAAYTMLFEHGYFHGDLHPGNVLILEGDVLGLLDFGMTGRLTKDMKDSLCTLIFALERGDLRTIARVFFDICIKEQRVDYAAFEADVIDVVERNWSGVSVKEMQIGRFLTDVTRGAMKHRVRAPHTYTMFFKALLTTEGLAKALLPEVDPLKAAQPYVQKLIAERYSPDRLREDGFYNLVALGTLGQRLPVSLSQLLDDIDKQRLTLNVRQVYDRTNDKARDRQQNRLIIALFAITGAVCGTMTIEVQVWGIPWLTLIFYASALPLFLLTLTMTLRNRG